MGDGLQNDKGKVGRWEDSGVPREHDQNSIDYRGQFGVWGGVRVVLNFNRGGKKMDRTWYARFDLVREADKE